MTKKTVAPILLLRGDDSVRVGESSFIVQAPKMLNEQKANSAYSWCLQEDISAIIGQAYFAWVLADMFYK